MSGLIVSPRGSGVRIDPAEGLIFHHSYRAPTTSIDPQRYAIELRDKDFNLKARLESVADSVSWEWNRIGGCGRCTFRLPGDYDRVDVSADDDIRIWLPDAVTGATLWYRGYVESVTPSINAGNDGFIQVECSGYFGLLDRIVANDSGDPLVYLNTEISLIVQDLVDDFIVANSSITRGTIEASSFIPDAISFKSSVKEALRTCFDLLGTVEYGVNADLEFYWHNQTETLRHVFYLGDKIVKLQDRFDFKNIVNKIFFEGGESAGSAYVTTGQSQTSINRYGKHEEIISNGSIYTASVASQFITSTLRQRGSPLRQLSIGLKNTTKRFEATLPIGACSVIDPAKNQTGAIYGTVGAGGSGKIYGSILNGGSGQIYGGVAKHQVDRVQYSLSPQDGRVHAEVQFGSSISYSRSSATLKRIQQTQEALRQRTL